MDLPAGARLRQYAAVKYAGLEIFPKTPEELDYIMPGWQEKVGGPTYYFGQNGTDNGLVLRVVATPGDNEAGKELLVTPSFVPLQSATTFDTDLMERYADAIANGAKAALMRQPKKPWTDKESAADYGEQFQTAIDKARIEVLHRFTTGSVHVRPRSFGSF